MRGRFSTQAVRLYQTALGRPKGVALHGDTVGLLRQSCHSLFIRATSGTPSKLRAFAERLTRASDELRFKQPAFSALLAALAAVASTTALRKESERTVRRFRTGAAMASGGTLRLTGTAKFSNRNV
jgi:hypothetical protein